MIRLFVNQPLAVGQGVQFSNDQLHYLQRVMRCPKGAEITLFNGLEGEFQAVFDGTMGLVQSQSLVDRELAVSINVIQGACRNERINHLLQKGTELGAASFTIVRCERSMLKLSGSRLSQRISRWQQIVIEAAEQSGRTKVPTVSWAHSLSELDHLQAESRWVLHLRQAQPWPQVRSTIAASTSLALAIGPEGGFASSDIDVLHQQGFQALQFGARTLRTETAAPALLAAIQAVL
ncbi:MAG: 16S rRNA (uracil(1498)-N(3))-methyltransferase [Mariprofundales bacterium]